MADNGACPSGTGLSQQAVEPVPVSPVPASIPSADTTPLMPWMYHEHGTRGDISKDEFCARFKAYMLRAGETFDGGESIAEYADETAPTYWEDPDMASDGPEACAAADMDYWGE